MGKRSSTTFQTARRWTPEQARAALAELSSSGLSMAAFARRAGLDAQRLRAWQQRLGVASAVKAPVFVEVPRRGLEHVEIVLPSGIMIRVAETVDAATVRRLADALSGDSRC